MFTYVQSAPAQRSKEGGKKEGRTLSMGILLPISLAWMRRTPKPSRRKSSAYQGVMADERQKTRPFGLSELCSARIARVRSHGFAMGLSPFLTGASELGNLCRVRRLRG